MSFDLCIQSVLDVRYFEGEHWHRTVSAPRGMDALVLMVKGEIEYLFAEKSVLASAGDLLFLPGDLPYCGKKHTDGVAFYVIDFLCTDRTAFAAFGAPCTLEKHADETDLAQFAAIASLWARQSIDAQMRVKAHLYEILSRKLAPSAMPKSVTSTAQIIDYVLSHLGDPSLGVAHLCREFFISESQLRRNLIKETGLRPNDYILRLRLNRARSLLLDSEKPLWQIAEECGFANQYYFSRCFSEAYGLPPSEFRKQYQ